MEHADAAAGNCLLLDRRIGFRNAGQKGYVENPNSSGIDVAKTPGISLTDLQKARAAGARIRRALIVERIEGDGRLYVPCLRFWGASKWMVVRTRRYEASRAWQNLDGVRTFLAKSGYNGAILIVPEGHRLLGALPGITDLWEPPPRP